MEMQKQKGSELSPLVTDCQKRGCVPAQAGGSGFQSSPDLKAVLKTLWK